MRTGRDFVKNRKRWLNMDIVPEIARRVSIRAFTEGRLERVQVERILEAGRLAPSAKNRQPWRFIAVEDGAKRMLLEKASYGQEHVGRAPLIIACCSTNIDYRMPNGQLSYPVDIGIAASFMMLQAVREGLGTCLVSTFDEQQVRDALSAPYLMRVVLLLLVGCTAEAPERPERHPIGRISSFDHW
jgi:nitroreductase